MHMAQITNGANLDIMIVLSNYLDNTAYFVVLSHNPVLDSGNIFRTVKILEDFGKTLFIIIECRGYHSMILNQVILQIINVDNVQILNKYGCAIR